MAFTNWWVIACFLNGSFEHMFGKVAVTELKLTEEILHQPMIFELADLAENTWTCTENCMIM